MYIISNGTSQAYFVSCTYEDSCPQVMGDNN